MVDLWHILNYAVPVIHHCCCESNLLAGTFCSPGTLEQKQVEPKERGNEGGNDDNDLRARTQDSRPDEGRSLLHLR